MKARTEKAQYCRHFSEIKGMQKESTISYFFVPNPSGIQLSVKEESEDGVRQETCLCPNLPISTAKQLMQLAYENNFGLGVWYDMLQDQGIRYTVI